MDRSMSFPWDVHIDQFKKCSGLNKAKSKPAMAVQNESVVITSWAQPSDFAFKYSTKSAPKGPRVYTFPQIVKYKMQVLFCITPIF